MKTRLKRELHDFLLRDGISLETSLFNDFVFQMAGIEFKEKESGAGFDLSSSWDKNETLQFSLPKIKLPQIKQLMQFLKLNPDDYEANSPLILNENFLFEELLPNFKSFYETTKHNNPESLAKYMVQSKPILESSAISTITDYTRKALKALITNDAAYENTTHGTQLVLHLLLLQSTVNSLREWPTLYKAVIASAATTHDMLKLLEVKQNDELNKYLQMINEGIELFKRFNRSKSVLANIQFMKDIEAFLTDEPLKISSSQCDIVESTLLKMANVTLGIKGKCHMQIGHDASRMVFEFDDINKQSTQNLVQFLQRMGDETAIEGSGYSRRGGPIPESTKSYAMMDFSLPERRHENYVESHSVEVDGKFLLETLLPKLKSEISALQFSEPATLKRYQDESRAFFEKKVVEENKTKNKHALFQPKPVSQSLSKAVEHNKTQEQNLDGTQNLKRMIV